MLIDSKIHALEVLNYVLHRRDEKEKCEIIRKSMVEVKRFGFKMDEVVFFKEIRKKNEAREFMVANGISTLEELVLKEYEYRMKYQWMIYKNVKGDADYCADDADGSDYLD
ncbi:hypothetical protein [Proteiniclasticum ruminis]|uniref:Uncharacterized protein n=1 Tax=Proteiniclasticum ruminis TaxID=398199 RepID=A0A1I5EU93_9CLOT|nr:hypothetical protein [Proteiniclasticum ruminis]SFO15009.1 hypothetical protein SAMN04488695_12114 [Proteiniclasticum ruminis]